MDSFRFYISVQLDDRCISHENFPQLDFVSTGFGVEVEGMFLLLAELRREQQSQHTPLWVFLKGCFFCMGEGERKAWKLHLQGLSALLQLCELQPHQAAALLNGMAR